jgi:hypothetical protein
MLFHINLQKYEYIRNLNTTIYLVGVSIYLYQVTYMLRPSSGWPQERKQEHSYVEDWDQNALHMYCKKYLYIKLDSLGKDYGKSFKNCLKL